MIVQQLQLTHFRNYRELELAFAPGCNLFFGENAQGKTNILEALFFLCFSRSFRTNKDLEVIQFDQPYVRVQGKFLLDIQIQHEVAFHCSAGEGKTILLEHKKVNRYSELIGKFPVVLLSPEDYKITSGGPVERRNLIDIFLSQVNPIYLKTLQKFQRILKQRNRILTEYRNKAGFNVKILEPWNWGLIETGSFLIKYRKTFVTEFYPLLAKIYSNLNLTNESIHFSYKPTLSFDDDADIETAFQQVLNRKLPLERARGITLTGPHRDDYIFELDGHDLRIYGSRGQHKSALVALKIAQFFFLKEKRNETPILLLDDLFSDLDQNRETKILETVQSIGQTFITTTRTLDMLQGRLKFKEYQVHNGTVKTSNF